MALAAAATLPLYDLTFGLMEALMGGLARNDTGYLLFNLSGAAIAALVMLPATFCAGMTLPLHHRRAAAPRRGRGGDRPRLRRQHAGRDRRRGARGACRPAAARAEVHAARRLPGRRGARPGAAELLRREEAVHLGGARRAPRSSSRLGAGVQLDAHKMTAGVFRHGDLSTSRDATVLLRPRRQDRHRAPGALQRGHQPAHQRQVRRLDQHGPRRGGAAPTRSPWC